MEELFRFHALRAAELPATVPVVSLDTGSPYQASLATLQGHDRSTKARQLSVGFLDSNRTQLIAWLDSKHYGALKQLLAVATGLRDANPPPSDASVDQRLRALVQDLFNGTPDQVIESTTAERTLVFDALLALRIANLPATTIARSVTTNPQALASALVDSARGFGIILDLHHKMTRDQLRAALQAKLVSDHVGLAAIPEFVPPPLPAPQAQLASALKTQADLTRFIVELESLCPAGLDETGAVPNRAPTPVIKDAIRTALESEFATLPQAIADVLGQGQVGTLSLTGFWYDHALAYEAKALQVQRVIDSLQKVVQQAPTPPVPTEPATPTVAGYLRVGGVSEVKVVRHHIVGYVGAELAHIENVLQGETRNRTFRTLDRSETTTSTETETSTEEEKEVKTEDSSSLQSSVDQTLKESLDLKVGFDLKAQLGSVDIGLNTSFAFARSKEETKKEASNFAKDVTNRAAKKVSQVVRTAQQTKVLHETEETVQHGFDGTQANGNIVGLYQWIEKIHRVQIFTLGSGARAIVDGVVLQPGQRLLGTPVGSGGAVTISAPPELDVSPADIFPWNYLSLAAKFGASAVPSPPPLITTASVSAANPQRTSDYGDNTTTFAQDIALPDGGAAAWAHATLTCEINGDWDQENAIAAIGPRTWEVNGTDGSGNTDASLVVYDKDQKVRQLRVRELKMLNGERGIVPCTVYGSRVQGISFVGLVSCVRTAEAMQNWQLSVFNALRAANAQANQDYQEAVSRATLAQAYNVGPAPGLVGDVIRDEIKRCAIAILANSSSPEDFYTSLDNYYKTGQASEVAKRVLFFEHALEWENMTYVLYPYFWADNRFDGWNQHMNRQEKDDQLVAFLKAGAARVVVPVRPLPEAAGKDVADFSAYLRAESLPSLDELIDVNSPLSLAIDAEIKAADGQDVEIFDDEWDINIPTELVTLRAGSAFPTWTENKQYVDGVRVAGEFVEDNQGSAGGTS